MAILLNLVKKKKKLPKCILRVHLQCVERVKVKSSPSSERKPSVDLAYSVLRLVWSSRPYQYDAIQWIIMVTM